MSGGLPGPLPQGERILWQGKPQWRAVARRVLHVPALAMYFGVLLAYSAAHSWGEGTPPGDVALTTLKFTGLALVPLALLTLYAWGTARSTTYTLTNRRIAIKMGIALPMTMNLPFARIDGAAFHPAKDGTGDVALQLGKGDRLAYLILWPHARPWRLAKAEPMLRAIPHAERVAQLLARALAASAEMPAAVRLQDAGAAATIASPHATAAA